MYYHELLRKCSKIYYSVEAKALYVFISDIRK